MLIYYHKPLRNPLESAQGSRGKCSGTPWDPRDPSFGPSDLNEYKLLEFKVRCLNLFLDSVQLGRVNQEAFSSKNSTTVF